MSSKIMTNKLDYKLSKENLFERYDIIQVKTSKDYFSYGAYILDLPSGQVNVRSVCFDGSNKFYILMAKNENNMNIIHQAIQSSDEYPYISLLCAGANEVPEYVILNLLLYFTLPNFSDIHKELASGNTFLRGKEYKETLFSACLDIKYFEKDGAVYYFVGKISQNVGYKFHVAANIRKIVAFRDHPLFFTSLLPLMNITFVHNGQLSAIPFPFKYLREYIASVISLPIEEDDNDDSDDTSN